MRHPPRSLMIFAAGFGTRMRPLTHTTPKALVEVAQRPLLDHALAWAGDAGLDRIVVNTHYLAEQIKAHLEGTRVLISHEPEILDTGGALKAALPLLGTGPIYTMNCDAIWAGVNPLVSLRQAWQSSQARSLLLCVEKARALGHTGGGDFAQGPPVQRPGPLIYTGAQIIDSADIADHPGDVFSLNEVWDAQIARRDLAIQTYPGRWCDVGHTGAIATAQRLLEDV